MTTQDERKGKAMKWIATTDKMHPDKPGLLRYEHIPCLIVRNRQILLRQWNCEDLVWDDEGGVNMYCGPLDVTYWMPLSDLPSHDMKDKALMVRYRGKEGEDSYDIINLV